MIEQIAARIGLGLGVLSIAGLVFYFLISNPIILLVGMLLGLAYGVGSLVIEEIEFEKQLKKWEKENDERS